MNIAELKAITADRLDETIKGLSDEKINRLVHEALGHCVHEWELVFVGSGQLIETVGYKCERCDKTVSKSSDGRLPRKVTIPDYCNEWAHSGPLLEKMWPTRYWDDCSDEMSPRVVVNEYLLRYVRTK